MSKEFKAPRPIQAIQQEYVQLCTKAGDLGYKIRCFEKDLSTVYDQLRELNFEAVASQQVVAAESARATEENKQADAEPNVAPVESAKE